MALFLAVGGDDPKGLSGQTWPWSPMNPWEFGDGAKLVLQNLVVLPS